jgi:hypothetical protein
MLKEMRLFIYVILAFIWWFGRVLIVIGGLIVKIKCFKVRIL